jgi:hypothetical protein
MKQRAIFVKLSFTSLFIGTLFLGACSKTSSQHENNFNSAQYAPSAQVAVQSIRKGIQDNEAFLVTDTLRKLVDDRTISSSFDWVFFWSELSNLSDENLRTFFSFENSGSAIIKNVRDPKTDERIDIDVFKSLYQRHEKFESFSDYQKFMLRALQIAPLGKASEHILGIFDLSLEGQPLETDYRKAKLRDSLIGKLDTQLLVKVLQKAGFVGPYTAQDKNLNDWLFFTLYSYTAQIEDYSFFNTELGLADADWGRLIAQIQNKYSKESKEYNLASVVLKKAFKNSSQFQIALTAKNIPGLEINSLVSIDTLLKGKESLDVALDEMNDQVDLKAVEVVLKTLDLVSNPQFASLEDFKKIIKKADEKVTLNLKDQAVTKLILENLSKRLFYLLRKLPKSEVLDPNIQESKLFTAHFLKLRRVHALPESIRKMRTDQAHQHVDETIKSYCESFSSLTGIQEQPLTVEGFQLPVSPGCYSLRGDIEFDQDKRSLVSVSANKAPVLSVQGEAWSAIRTLDIRLAKSADNLDYFGMVLRTGGTAIKVEDGGESTQLFVDSSYKAASFPDYNPTPDELPVDAFAVPLFFQAEFLPKDLNIKDDQMQWKEGFTYLLTDFLKNTQARDTVNQRIQKGKVAPAQFGFVYHHVVNQPRAFRKDIVQSKLVPEFVRITNSDRVIEVFVGSEKQNHEPVPEARGIDNIVKPDQIKTTGLATISLVNPSLAEVTTNMSSSVEFLKKLYQVETLEQAIRYNTNLTALIESDQSKIYLTRWKEFKELYLFLAESFGRMLGSLNLPVDVSSRVSLLKGIIELEQLKPLPSPENQGADRSSVQNLEVVKLAERLIKYYTEMNKLRNFSDRTNKLFNDAETNEHFKTWTQTASHGNMEKEIEVRTEAFENFIESDSWKKIINSLEDLKDFLEVGSEIISDPTSLSLYNFYDSKRTHDIEGFVNGIKTRVSEIRCVENYKKDTNKFSIVDPKTYKPDALPCVSDVVKSIPYMKKQFVDPFKAKYDSFVEAQQKIRVAVENNTNRAVELHPLNFYSESKEIQYKDFLKKAFSESYSKDLKLSINPLETKNFVDVQDVYSKLRSIRDNGEARSLLTTDEAEFVSNLKKLVGDNGPESVVREKMQEIGETENAKHFNLQFSIPAPAEPSGR